jgi:hypothetical protein
VWTRDGLRLTYLSERDGVRHLMSQPSDSSAPAESLLTSRNDDLVPGSWSADGRSLVYVDSARTGNSELSVLRIDGRQVATLSGIPASSNRPAISPDGRWLAFGIPVSEASGRPAITSGRFQAPGRHGNSSMPPASQCGAGTARRSSFAAGAAGPPVYAGDGIFEMPFNRSRGIAAGPERQLFRKAFAEDGWMGVAGYDVAPDGRFLLIIPDESESLPFDMHVLLHVDDELRRRVP